MKEQEKQIEDIALLLQSYSNISQSYYSGEWHSDDVYHGLAKSLYYNNLRIVSKDSVVISMEEWKQIKNSLYYSKEALEKKLAKASKETAEKIFAEIDEYFDNKINKLLKIKKSNNTDENDGRLRDCCECQEEVKELAKQLGVDLGVGV